MRSFFFCVCFFCSFSLGFFRGRKGPTAVVAEKKPTERLLSFHCCDAGSGALSQSMAFWRSDRAVTLLQEACTSVIERGVSFISDDDARSFYLRTVLVQRCCPPHRGFAPIFFWWKPLYADSTSMLMKPFRPSLFLRTAVAPEVRAQVGMAP